jgi:hypothetical protein
VIFQTVSDGAVLLHADQEVYFGLNRVGARVWSLLPPATRSFAQLCDELAREYPDVAPQALHDDVAELLTELAHHGLVDASA